jgi:hypothetical protein
MKSFNILIALLWFSLASCNQKPTNPQVSTAEADTSQLAENSSHDYAIMLDEAMVYSIKHHFSDSLTEDSFVVELPAGDIWASQYCLKVFNSRAQLIYQNSVDATSLMNGSQMEGKAFAEKEKVLDNVKFKFSGLSDSSNFVVSANAVHSKNNVARDTINTIGFNEAINNPTTLMYRYDDGFTTTYIMYSKKLQKVIVVFKEEYVDY